MTPKLKPSTLSSRKLSQSIYRPELRALAVAVICNEPAEGPQAPAVLKLLLVTVNVPPTTDPYEAATHK